MAAPTRAQMNAALEKVLKDAGGKFPKNPARLAQLASHIRTAQMCVDHLHDETPYVLRSEG